MMERAHTLLALAYRCEWEKPSRELDGAIYCAVHDVVDLNGLQGEELREKRRNGEVAVENHKDAEIGWRVAPLYTFRMEAAQMLLGSFSELCPNNARRTCAFALRALATDIGSDPSHRMVPGPQWLS